MRRSGRFAAILVCACLAHAADKEKKVSGKGSNDVVEITASLILSREALKSQFGTDFDGNYIFVNVTISPKLDALAISRDDFLLRTDKDGERTTPFVPSQIAGSGVLVISSTGGRGAMVGEDRGPIWGGYPGSGQRPRRMGSDGGAIGNTAESGAQAAVHSADKKEDPVIKILEAKILPEKKTEDPVSGMLYFPLSIKQKVKDLGLIYTSKTGKVEVRFKEN
jgi:hypothetical protein